MASAHLQGQIVARCDRLYAYLLSMMQSVFQFTTPVLLTTCVYDASGGIEAQCTSC